MLEYWIIVTIGVIAVACAVCGAYLYIEARELRLVQNRTKLKVYDELFHAITELNAAGGDEYKLDQGKRRLAFTLNRLNLVASPEVLMRVNELLDFFNESKDGDFEILKQLNILNNLMRAARRDLDPASAKVLEEAEFRFRFYNPPRT